MTTASKTEPTNVYQRLNEAREAFHATKLKKTGKNAFAGYSYFELGDFVVPAMQIFAKHGLCAVISFTAELATMTVVNVDDPSDREEFTSPMGSANLKGCHEVQNIGAVETYQRRYLWTVALEIVEHDALDATTGRDAGGQDVSKAEAPKNWKGEIPDAEWAQLVKLLEVTKADGKAMLGYFKVADLRKLNSTQYAEAVNILNAKLAKAAKEKTNAIADDLGDSIPY